MNEKRLLKGLGMRIKELRKAKGLTQAETAIKSNLSRFYLGEVERGSRNIAILNLNKIAEALETDIKDLF